MKMTGKPVGVFFLGFALVMAVLLLPGAVVSESPQMVRCAHHDDQIVLAVYLENRPSILSN